LAEKELQEHTAYYNDNNAFCCKVLRKNIALGNLPGGKVDERDIREVTGEDLEGFRQIHLFAGIGGFPLGLKWAGMPENFSIVTGGFPCQPFSIAGKRKGPSDDRFLWPEMLRLVRIVKPAWIFAENVPGLLTLDGGMVIEQMLSSLENAGYEVFPPFTIPACAVDAPQIRQRIFILAYSNSEGLEGIYEEGWRINLQSTQKTLWRQWKTEPGVDRVVARISGRMDRLIALGNAVVPQVVEIIGRCILQVEREA